MQLSWATFVERRNIGQYQPKFEGQRVKSIMIAGGVRPVQFGNQAEVNR